MRMHSLGREGIPVSVPVPRNYKGGRYLARIRYAAVRIRIFSSDVFFAPKQYDRIAALYLGMLRANNDRKISLIEPELSVLGTSLYNPRNHLL